MKAAEEWCNQVGKTVMADCFAGDRNALPGEPTINLIQQIQLDAMREGMRRAAELVYQKSPVAFRTQLGHELLTRKQSILNAATNLTPTDLPN